MDLQCDFDYLQFGQYLKTVCACLVTEASITEPNTKVTSISGKLHKSKTYKDVEGILFAETAVIYFPRGLGFIFPRLKCLAINDCGLKKISREDLQGLENLEVFKVSDNELKSLPSDLFIGMKKLKQISFYGNKLEFVSSELLKPIMQNGLTRITFRNNVKIDAIFDADDPAAITLEQLMEKIDKQCAKPVEDGPTDKAFKDDLANGIAELWKSGRLSDFTIAVGSKEFKVHKNVLAISSPVFAAMFENDVEETRTNKMKIEEFSADAVEQFVGYMYTGNISEEAHAMELFALAAKYDVPKLKSIGETLVVKNLNDLNALQIFALAHLHSAADMKRKAFVIIRKSFAGKQVPTELFYDPKRLKELIEADRARKRKIDEAEEVFEKLWNKPNGKK